MHRRAALRMVMAVALVTVGWLGWFGWAGTAQAGDLTTIPCGLVDEGTIHVDGLLSDWEGVSPMILKVHPAPGMSGRTLAVRVSCNYGPKNVYLLVDVDDDIIIRGKDAGPTEDHLELAFGIDNKAGEHVRIDKLMIWPGANPQKQPRVVRWEAKSPPKVVPGEGPAGRDKPLKGGPVFEVYDALQPRGYAVELRLPKKIIPGFIEGSALKLALKVVDGDGPGAVGYAETAPVDRADGMSEVEFEEGQAGYGDLLKDLKVRSEDVFFEKNADLGDGVGHVVMVGKFLAFTTGKSYAYLEMAPSRSDIKDVQLIPLQGDQQAVALRLAEHGSGGGREVLRIYRLAGGRFEPLFASEVAKEQGPKRLSVQVNYVKKGKSTELELVPQPAVGFSEASYGELPAEDVIPILLPWQDKKTRYGWKGGQGGKFVKL